MITRFTDGTQASVAQLMQAIGELRTPGQAAIDSLVTLREDTLFTFNNALSALNGRQVRVNRLAQASTAAKFIVSDLDDIDQANTTATVRADANAVSLKQRNAPGEALVQSTTFSSNDGMIQTLNSISTITNGVGVIYRVATSDGSTPVGTFNLVLTNPLSTSLIIFDIMDMPSSPTVTVAVSTNGISYTNSTSITRNGYRFAAWFNPQEIQNIQISITPAVPDILGGNVFTFGLTAVDVIAVQYHLRSDLYTKTIQTNPQGASWQFTADTTPGITYFLAMAGQPALEVNPGDIVSIPGTTVVTNHNSAIDFSTGKLAYTLPSNVYLSTLSIVDASSQVIMRLAPGLSHTITGLTNQYITLDTSGNMYLVVYNSGEDSGRTFNISFVSGPAVVTVQLQVELTTEDLNNTPIFHSASLEAV